MSISGHVKLKGRRGQVVRNFPGLAVWQWWEGIRRLLCPLPSVSFSHAHIPSLPPPGKADIFDWLLNAVYNGTAEIQVHVVFAFCSFRYRVGLSTHHLTRDGAGLKLWVDSVYSGERCLRMGSIVCLLQAPLSSMTLSPKHCKIVVDFKSPF